MLTTVLHCCCIPFRARHPRDPPPNRPVQLRLGELRGDHLIDQFYHVLQTGFAVAGRPSQAFRRGRVPYGAEGTASRAMLFNSALT
jgi:hypothetical protein